MSSTNDSDMPSDNEYFEYTSPLQGRDIRLVYVQPTRLEESLAPIEVILKECSPDTAEFDALSYVWRTKLGKYKIRCNGKTLHVGQNLHEALIEYRRHGSPRAPARRAPDGGGCTAPSRCRSGRCR